MIEEIVLPTLQKAIRDDMDARDMESVSMLARGFVELKETNPELAYNLILDILGGINECVLLASSFGCWLCVTDFFHGSVAIMVFASTLPLLGAYSLIVASHEKARSRSVE